MISYRAQLARIGVAAGAAVSFRDFAWQPGSLLTAVRAMDGPGELHKTVERSIDSSGWTEECQGVAWDGSNWIFSSNGSQAEAGLPLVGHMPKALYTFPGHADLDDDGAVSETFVLAEAHPFDAGVEYTPRIPEPPNGGPIYHVGPLAFVDGTLYVDHWNQVSGGHLIVLTDSGGTLSFSHWIPLVSPVGDRVGLVAVEPGTGRFYTCRGDVDVSELYLHEPDGHPSRHADGTARVLALQPPITDGCYVQGGAFSVNGHLYISSGRSGVEPYQYVYVYSALNGHLLSTIRILTEDSGQELEGICLADLEHKGTPVQLHVVLLANHALERDDIFFKQLTAATPALL